MTTRRRDGGTLLPDIVHETQVQSAVRRKLRENAALETHAHRKVDVALTLAQVVVAGGKHCSNPISVAGHSPEQVDVRFP